MPPLLRAENLTIRPPRRWRWLHYRETKRKLLDDISFELEEGKTTGLVGDTGSGKFSLSLAMLRVERVSRGRIFFGASEENILELSKRRFHPLRRQMQLLVSDERQALNPRHSIGKQMQHLLKLHLPKLNSRERNGRIQKTIRAVELPSAALSRTPGELIAAHRQRAAIAKALAVEPKLLICHDITSALDVTVQAELLNLLKDLREQFQLTLFFITHDLAIADHMSDRILILNRGRIVERGITSDVVENPQHDYTRRLVDSTASLR